MSNERAKALINLLHTDDDFSRRFNDAAPEDRRALLEAEGYGDIKLKHLSEALPESRGGELTEDEFAGVAGGLGILPESQQPGWDYHQVSVAILT